MTINDRAVYRLTLVNELVTLSRPIDQLVVQLAELDWDYEGEGVELTRSHMAFAIQRYLSDELSQKELESWANLIEGREDVYFESAHKEILEELIFALANPMLTDTLDRERATQLIERLSIY